MNIIATAKAQTRFLRTTITRLQQLQQHQTQRQLTYLHLTTQPATPSPCFLRHQVNIPSRPNRKLYSTSTPNNTIDSNGPKSRPGSSNVEVPVIDFQSLGIKGTAKIVVIAVICVLGTVETVFWCKVGWRWWKGEANGNREKADNEP